MNVEPIEETEDTERPLDADEERLRCSQCKAVVLVRVYPTESRRKFWRDPETRARFVCEPCTDDVIREQRRNAG